MQCASRPEFLSGSEAESIELEFAGEIQAREIRVLSLDVFDTFLLRNNIPETQRYLEISRRIAAAISGADQSAGGEEIDQYDLLLERLRALELNYRTRPALDGCREGLLTDVLKTQRLALNLPASSEEMMLRTELMYEAESLTANPVLSNLARKFRKAGGKVILLSDMYLGKKEIAEVIGQVDEDLRGCFDEIFSSADTILSKRSGKVFGLVEKRLDQKAEHILHIGDSWNSDVHMARLAGWHAMHFPISASETFARERNLKAFMQDMYARNLDLGRWAKI